MHNYTEEQKKDILAREKEGLEALTKLQLNLAASAFPINIGDDTFATKIVPFLQDTKYTPVKSPLNEKDIKAS